MPRIARVVAPNIPHHVTQRGNRNQKVFFSDSDRRYYLRLIQQFAVKSQCQIWAYCLMDNHVHFIVVPKTLESLTQCFQEAHRKYTLMINTKKSWKGYLWQGRYSSFVMDENHLVAAVRYVERNPVEANMVDYAEQYSWSSARAHVLGLDDPLLSQSYLTNQIRDWKKYLRDSSDKNGNLFEKHGRTGRPLGSTEFLQDLEKKLNRKLIPSRAGRRPKKK